MNKAKRVAQHLKENLKQEAPDFVAADIAFMEVNEYLPGDNLELTEDEVAEGVKLWRASATTGSTHDTATTKKPGPLAEYC